MSEMLEKIERLASAKSITDPGLIDEITKRFLNIRYSELGRQKGFETFVPWDLAKGLYLNERSVTECTIGEILTLINMELFDDWYEPPKKDNQFFAGYFPNTACDCFMFVRLLCDKYKKNVYANLFMNIDYMAFMRYLLDSFIKTSGNADNEAAVGRRRSQIGSAYYQAADLIFAARKAGNDPHEKNDSGFTVGEVLNTVNKQGTAMWMCGTKPLIEHAESVRMDYLIANSLFMDCIKPNLISMDREQERELICKCRSAVKHSGLRVALKDGSLINFDTKGE